MLVLSRREKEAHPARRLDRRHRCSPVGGSRSLGHRSAVRRIGAPGRTGPARCGAECRANGGGTAADSRRGLSCVVRGGSPAECTSSGETAWRSGASRPESTSWPIHHIKAAEVGRLFHCARAVTRLARAAGKKYAHVAASWLAGLPATCAYWIDCVSFLGDSARQPLPRRPPEPCGLLRTACRSSGPMRGKTRAYSRGRTAPVSPL